MMVEVGDMSDLGEAWVRYQGNRVIQDLEEILRYAARADVNGALAEARAPQLVHFYDIGPDELDEGYRAGGCWVFRVCPV